MMSFIPGVSQDSREKENQWTPAAASPDAGAASALSSSVTAPGVGSNQFHQEANANFVKATAPEPENTVSGIPRNKNQEGVATYDTVANPNLAAAHTAGPSQTLHRSDSTSSDSSSDMTRSDNVPTSQHEPGGYYSGRHKIPTIQGFIKAQKEMMAGIGNQSIPLSQTNRQQKAATGRQGGHRPVSGAPTIPDEGLQPEETEQGVRKNRNDGAGDGESDLDAESQDGSEENAYEDSTAGPDGTGKKGSRNPLKKKQRRVRLVTDPTTGREAVIEDVPKRMLKQLNDPKITVPSAAIVGNESKPVLKTDPTQPLPEYLTAQDHTSPPGKVAPGSTEDVPIHGERTNVLFHPTPTISFEPMFAALEARSYMLCAGAAAAIVFVGSFLGSLSIFLTFPLAGAVAAAIYLWSKEVIRSGREMEWESEKKRGEIATVNLVPESVEWLNSLLKVFWRLINPEMFAAVVDTLEDVMQASVPGVIENVRVADMNQGSNPIRILSLRSLPDGMMESIKDSIRQANAESHKDPNQAAAEEEGGDFYNLEASFAYHAAPTGERTSDKARNIHIQLVFYFGIKGLFGVPIPIFVELQRLVGTVRMRINMTPQPPFLNTLTMTFMGVPHIEVGCIPMVQRGVNILNLPLISNFVQMAIKAATSMYVAPKSLTIDLASILQGDDVLKDTSALGILWVRIKRAAGLSKQDKRGSRDGGSDPYITLTFSKYGKPMWCSRVITDDLNPVWEESTALLVTPELIKARENLSVELWDSDRHTADDVVGKVEYSIRKMMRRPGVMRSVVSTLKGVDADSSMPGELYWEVGYFPKAPFRSEMRTSPYKPPRPATEKRFASSKSPERGQEKSKTKEAAKPVSKEEEFDAKIEREANESRIAVMDDFTDEEPAKEAVLHTPPDPTRPTGIVHVVIHQIVNLQLEDIKGSHGSRKGGKEYTAAKSYGETTEQEGKELPTSYCTILINDDLAYRTRSKPVSGSPIFNAGTERCVRDWRSAIVTVTVRDSRNREHDPILGVIPLKLSEILSRRSQVTRWYPLDGGIGFGRIRISLLFRSVDIVLPPRLLGWDVGTFEFMSPEITAEDFNTTAGIKVYTAGSEGKVSKSLCKSHQSQSGVAWDISPQTNQKDSESVNQNSEISMVSPVVRLPIKNRYRSPVVFEFRPSRTKLKADTYAMLWLNTLVDNEDTPVNICIWRTKNPSRLLLNHLTDEDIMRHAKAYGNRSSMSSTGGSSSVSRLRGGSVSQLVSGMTGSGSSAKDEATSPAPPADIPSDPNEVPLIKGIEDLEIVGRLRFRCRFKAGLDESHEGCIKGNDDRETYETWEACVAEGVRKRYVKQEMSSTVRRLHEQSMNNHDEHHDQPEPVDDRTSSGPVAGAPTIPGSENEEKNAGRQSPPLGPPPAGPPPPSFMDRHAHPSISAGRVNMTPAWNNGNSDDASITTAIVPPHSDFPHPSARAVQPGADHFQAGPPRDPNGLPSMLEGAAVNIPGPVDEHVANELQRRSTQQEREPPVPGQSKTLNQDEDGGPNRGAFPGSNDASGLRPIGRTTVAGEDSLSSEDENDEDLSSIDSDDEYAGMAQRRTGHRHSTIDRGFGAETAHNANRLRSDGTRGAGVAVGGGINDENAYGPRGGSSGGSSSSSGASGRDTSKRTLERKHRGMMQWRPVRNAKFAKDGAIIGMRKLKNMVKGGLDGRSVAVESETAN